MKNSLFLFLFIALLFTLQTSNNILLGALTIVGGLLYFKVDKFGKSFIITTVLFGIGFYIYLFFKDFVIQNVQSHELHIFLDRLSLIMIILPLLLYSLILKKRFNLYWRKPDWDGIIQFPFIWSGNHLVKVKKFIIIAISVNIVVMLPFMIMNGWTSIREVFLIAIIFSFTNAILEEFIWRGALLTRFSETVGEKWAVFITSIGFGLQHYSLGFPWLVCIAFSFGGFFYAVVTIKSKSILPAVLWHIVLNFLMVFSGLIVK